MSLCVNVIVCGFICVCMSFVWIYFLCGCLCGCHVSMSLCVDVFVCGCHCVWKLLCVDVIVCGCDCVWMSFTGFRNDQAVNVHRKGQLTTLRQNSLRAETTTDELQQHCSS